jgi:hypothetical protein
LAAEDGHTGAQFELDQSGSGPIGVRARIMRAQGFRNHEARKPTTAWTSDVKRL